MRMVMEGHGWGAPENSLSKTANSWLLHFAQAHLFVLRPSQDCYSSTSLLINQLQTCLLIKQKENENSPRYSSPWCSHNLSQKHVILFSQQQTLVLSLHWSYEYSTGQRIFYIIRIIQQCIKPCKTIQRPNCNLVLKCSKGRSLFQAI